MKKGIKILVFSLLLCSTVLTMSAQSASVFPAIAAQTQSTLSGKLSDGFSWSLDAASKVLTIEGKGTLHLDSDGEWIQYQGQFEKIILDDRITSITSDYLNIDFDTLVLGASFKQCPEQGIIPNTAFEIGRNNRYFSVYDGALYTKNGKELLRAPKRKEELTYPDTLRIIGERAFSGSEADIIIIPWGVTTICDDAFMEIGALIVLPETLKKIGNLERSRYHASYYLWEGENELFQTVAEKYGSDSERDLLGEVDNGWLSQFWKKNHYRRISDICKGVEGTPITGWYSMGGYTFYFSSDHKPVTGWQNIDGKWYSFGANGVMRVGLFSLQEGYSEDIETEQMYYFGDDGVLVTNMIIQYNDRIYYADKRGIVNEMDPFIVWCAGRLLGR